MALQFSTVLAEANAFEEVINQAVVLESLINQLLEHNSDLAIDWTAGSTPAYISEEANGNILGKNYTRQQVGTAVSSLDWIRKLLTNQSMTGSQGDHIGVLNVIAKPLG